MILTIRGMIQLAPPSGARRRSRNETVVEREKSSGLLTTCIGLALALAGPPVVAICIPPIQALARLPDLTAALLGQLGLWLVLGGLLAVVLIWERQPRASLGIQKLRWSTPLLGLGIAALMVHVVGPFSIWVTRSLGTAGFSAGLARQAIFPGWYKVAAAITAGVVEEVCYRGYAVERLATVTGNIWLASAVSVTAFVLAHVPLWGWGPAPSFLITSSVLTGIYLWRRDVMACALGHAVTDAAGLLTLA